MLSFRHTFCRLSALAACSLLLSIVFTSCSFSAGNSPTAATQPTPAPKTTQAPAATQPPATQAPTLSTYPGDGFKIGYPAGWKITPATDQVTILDPSDTTGNTGFIVSIHDPVGGSVSASMDALVKLVTDNLQITNTQDLPLDQSQVSIANEVWNDKAFDGDVQGTRLTFRFTVTFHSSNGATKAYGLVRLAPKDKWDNEDATYFTPMTNSFQFT